MSYSFSSWYYKMGWKIQMVQISRRKGGEKKEIRVQVLSKCSDEPQTATQIKPEVLTGGSVLNWANAVSAQISVQTFPGTVIVTQVEKGGSKCDILSALEEFLLFIHHEAFHSDVDVFSIWHSQTVCT